MTPDEIAADRLIDAVLAPVGADPTTRADSNVVTFPKPTRTPAEPDMPPCRNTWGPLDCHHAGRRRGPHVCWTWRGWPHVCRCLHCSTSREVGA
jgi:hypothetical protein